MTKEGHSTYFSENPAYEVSPECVKKIESLNIPVDTKAEILLVLSGVKPAAWITIPARIWSHGEEPHVYLSDADVESFYNVIKESTLAFEIIPRVVTKQIETIRGKSVPYYTDTVEVRIGTTEEDLASLLKVFTEDEVDRELLGKALGIPETAVDAFEGKRERVNLYTVQKEVLLRDALLFTPTRVLSKDNWENEIMEGQKRADMLKQLSPEIYTKVREKAVLALKQQGMLSDEVRAGGEKKNI